uniref:Uncharacterized protein n=1 Tax=Cannabis sativa TaxID=3483 RepID=A0A803PFM5_CANSA
MLNIAHENNKSAPQSYVGSVREVEHAMKPLANMIKINTDVVIFDSARKFDFSIIIRDSAGVMVEPRVCCVEGVVRTYMVEALGVKKALNWLKNNSTVHAQITAELENLTDLQPQGGCDDPNFSYLFKLKCGRCGEETQKETSLTLSETVPLAVGKGTVHLSQKCKFCGRDGTITMIPGRGKPLSHGDSEAGKFSPLMMFECRGYEPLNYLFVDGWKAVSLEGTKFDEIDLSDGEFAEYDEKGECPVMISNLRSTFVVVK